MNELSVKDVKLNKTYALKDDKKLTAKVIYIGSRRKKLVCTQCNGFSFRYSIKDFIKYYELIPEETNVINYHEALRYNEVRFISSDFVMYDMRKNVEIYDTNNVYFIPNGRTIRVNKETNEILE